MPRSNATRWRLPTCRATRERFGGGAKHAQAGASGRIHPYFPLLEPGAQALAMRIKDALDPGRRMNLGVLGFT